MSDDDRNPQRGLPGLALDRIQSLLTTASYGRSLDVRAETRSTNDDARAAALAGAARGHVVLANGQTQGRGSHGRIWSSPAGTDLYLSIIDRPRVDMAHLPPLTLAVGLGVAEAVAAHLEGDAAVEVKWPNDVWVSGHKCAGILLEAASSGQTLESLIIGIGLNVNRTSFPPDLDYPATSMSLSAARDFDRAQVLASVLARVEAWVERFVQEGPAPVVAELADRLALRGEIVTCGATHGELLGVAADGALRVRTAAGEARCIAGRLMRG